MKDLKQDSTWNLIPVQSVHVETSNPQMMEPAPYLRFSVDVYSVQPAGERVDDDEDVTKLCRDDATSVVSCVLRPHDMNLIITKVTHLQNQEKDSTLLLC